MWLLVIVSSIGFSFAQNLLSVEEALNQGFPNQCRAEKELLYPNANEIEEIKKRSGSAPHSKIFTRYRAVCPTAEVQVFAYLDTHMVRTKNETLLIFVNENSQVTRVEAVAFHEPPEYLPKPAWFKKFQGHTLNDELQTKRGIPWVTGASLTTREATLAVRRTLALHQILQGKQKKK